jgi:ssDNA thymidine ADP-ribosyltransferase, DarT
MPLNPEQLGKLLNSTHSAWAELQNATLRHRNGWELQVRGVKFRPPYCTLITRMVDGAERELHFNTEALASGVFVSIDLEGQREQIIENAIAKEIEKQQEAEHARQQASAERKERLAAQATERATNARAAEAEAAAPTETRRTAEERKRLEAKATAAKRVEDWHHCLEARKVTRLTHFTRLPNLYSVLELGLYPVTDFKELPKQPLRNDDVRYDHRLDHVSLSVTHPNDALFWRWHMHTYQADTWVVLSVDPAVLWELPSSMFFTNAAASGGRTPLNESEQPLASDFEKLFVELPEGPARSQLGHAPMDTTNPQAEVMIRAKIALTYIRGIGVRSHADLGKVSQIAGAGNSGIPLTVEPWLFDMRRCASEFRRAMLTRQGLNSSETALRSDFVDDELPI